MAKSFQITLPDSEQQKLIYRIENDFLMAKASHQRRAQRCAEWMQKWEARVNPPRAGDEDKPNHTVPLLQWQCFNKMARDLQALLGEDAEITARPTGPSDRDVVTKVGRYMTSRLFDQMEILNPLAEFEFRRILNGWAVAYRPWMRREFTTLVNGQREQVCDYEGPGFVPLEDDDFVVPNERGVKSLQDFSFVIHRQRVTVDDLQRGAGTLYYDSCAEPEFVERAINWAQQGSTNDYTLVGQDPVRTEREQSEGVDYDSFMLGRRSIWVWNWYGKWRPLKGKSQEQAEENDIQRREIFEADWVVRFIPGMKEIVGCQDLLQLYPKMRKRRPFVESTLIKDGTYRPKGFGALLADIEDDLTANSRLFQSAGELSVWPIVFFKPGGGMNPGAIKMEPGMAYATEDPASVNVIKIQPNLEFAEARQLDLITTAERVTNINDQSMGRAMSQPNAPKTATGQLALIEEGNVRAYLDATILREDMEQIIADFWDLDCDLVPKMEKDGSDSAGIFFRVTEEQANGLFDVRKGGAFMTPKEFGGRYDFRLKFAVSVYARNAKKAEFMAFYQAAIMNPLCQQNPTALWALLNMLAKQFQIDFEDIIPKPPQLDQPQTPDKEWTEMLEGETVEVNPQDHDDLHIQQHILELEDERKLPPGERDAGAIGLMVQHIIDHQQQKRTKAMMQALTSQLMASIQPPQQNPMQQTLQQVAQLAPMYGGQAPGMPGQPGMQPPGAPGEIPAPPQQVGASMAPQPVEGQL
jgi:hypothetical protein